VNRFEHLNIFVELPGEELDRSSQRHCFVQQVKHSWISGMEAMICSPAVSLVLPGLCHVWEESRNEREKLVKEQVINTHFGWVPKKMGGVKGGVRG
jgi:hypothetical protein